ncbi:MAG: carboxy terminal-processing peptidase [Chitinophagaceae bacterium]
MKIRFLVVGAILVGSAVGVLAFKSNRKPNTPPNREEAIVTLIGEILKKGQYDPKPFNDSFSAEVFNKYLADLDGEKKFFLQSDIKLISPFKTEISDEINGNQPLDFLHQTNTIFENRVLEAEKIYPGLLEKPFDFHRNDSIQLDMTKSPYAKSEADLAERWRKMLKYRVLDQYVELKEIQQKAKKDSANFHGKSNAELQDEAREKVKVSFDKYFDHFKSTFFNEKDRFSMFINDITHSMDPHTDYFPPVEKRYFDEQMAGTFYGIGALLQQSDDKIKIASIVTGGPAWKEGELKSGDVILKVGQGDKEPVDLNGFTTEDAVKIIRGDKGTIVKLTVKRTDGTIKTISIERGEVKLEDTFARSYIIQNDQHKIGYIVLPEFYANFEDKNAPRSSEDIAKEIVKLKNLGVDGIILDLRFNGGGSLSDAVDIAGEFVPQGPVVQVRSRNGEVQVLSDHDKTVDYQGPLAIMVNEYSASASEILAAALQDYKRAVIIGSPSTYGKGTVQRMFDLDDFYSGDKSVFGGSLGAIKLTIQKFYRINGGSTQLKGVTPDIILPDTYFGVAEKTDKDALPWDQIAKANYQTWDKPLNLKVLQIKSEERVSHSPAFEMVNQNIDLLKKLEAQKSFSLNIVQYKKEQNQNDSALSQMDAVSKLVKSLDISNLAVDLPGIQADSIKVDRNIDLLKLYKKDIYLHEAVKVMDDMINLPSLQKGKLTKIN